MVNKKRMKKEKKKNLIFANIGRVLYKLGSTVKSSAVRTKDKLSLNVNNTDNYGYVGLWYDVCADEGLGHRDKLSYLKDIFMSLKVEDDGYYDRFR